MLLATTALLVARSAQAQLPDPLELGGPATPNVGVRPFMSNATASDTPSFWAEDAQPLFGIGTPDPTVPGPLWSLQPSVQVDGVATDNLRGSAVSRTADVYTRIIPRLTLSADTAEVVGALTYAPRLSLYASNSDQNRLDQLFAGNVLATLVPDLLFIEAQGRGDARSVFGDFAGFDSSTQDSNNRVQATTFSISPYLVRRFGGLATARVGYRFRQSSLSGRDTSLPGESTPFFTSQDFTAHEVYGVVRSGEDWGRFAFQVQASYTSYDGSGIYNNAHRALYVLQTRYSVTREVALLLDGGWQDDRYGGVRPYIIRDPIWGVGIRYAPDEESFITLRYGQRDGFTSFSLNANFPVGVRTRVFARYGESITSSALLSNDLLAGLRVDANGNLIDAATGVPAAVAVPTSLLNTQSGLFRLRRGTVSLSQIWPRDTLTLTLLREEREPVLIEASSRPVAQKNISATLSWGRALAPGISLLVSGQIAQTETERRGSGMNYSVRAALSRQLSPNLFGTLQYVYQQREQDLQPGRADTNIVLVSLRQFF